MFHNYKLENVYKCFNLLNGSLFNVIQCCGIIQCTIELKVLHYNVLFLKKDGSTNGLTSLALVLGHREYDQIWCCHFSCHKFY